jgi:hypothetical protein
MNKKRHSVSLSLLLPIKSRLAVVLPGDEAASVTKMQALK